MAKPRILMDDGYYHVINRGNNGLSIFDPINSFQTFKFILYDSKKHFEWKLFHYCLMPNHFHLLMQVAKGKDLPKIMQSITMRYSYWHKKVKKYEGQLWQHRYRSPNIDKDSYLLECGRYIERNPVRAGITSRLADYPWSSFNHYAFGKNDHLIDEDPCFSDFGVSELERQKRYREFVSLEGPYDQVLDQTLVPISQNPVFKSQA